MKQVIMIKYTDIYNELSHKFKSNQLADITHQLQGNKPDCVYASVSESTVKYYRLPIVFDVPFPPPVNVEFSFKVFGTKILNPAVDLLNVPSSVKAVESYSNN